MPVLPAAVGGQSQVEGGALPHAVALLDVGLAGAEGVARGRGAQRPAGPPAEQLVRGVVGRHRLDVALQEVEVTVVQAPQKVSAGPQHPPPVGRVSAVGQAGDQSGLDVVERLEQVEDVRVLVEQLSDERGATARGGQDEDVSLSGEVVVEVGILVTNVLESLGVLP